VSQVIEGAGTSEATWAAWDRLTALPLLSLPGRCPVLVVAPHPDDEVLGVGGTLVELQTIGAEITVLALTDGEASHPGASISPDELGARRADESQAAMRELLGGCRIDRLGLPDGGLEDSAEAVQRAVEQRVAPGTWCFAPLREDGHPDHEAAGRAAARACRSRGARLLEYPIWMWHWSGPEDPRVPWERAQRVVLSLEARWRKARAIDAFESQIAPLLDRPGGEAILPPAVLQRFLRPSELCFL
jgi:LmbE family N-acetylglucosaminyl deacetylase